MSRRPLLTGFARVAVASVVLTVAVAASAACPCNTVTATPTSQPATRQTAGTAVTFSTRVQIPDANKIASYGTVRFRTEAGTIAGCEQSQFLNGYATCTTSALAVGTHQIIADYSGYDYPVLNPSSSAALTFAIVSN
jgi:hypothetical protein